MNMNCSRRDVVVIGNANTVRIDSWEGRDSNNCDSYDYMYIPKSVVFGIICIGFIVCALCCCYRRNKQTRCHQSMVVDTQSYKNNKSNDTNC
jgi:hypothetical protein